MGHHQENNPGQPAEKLTTGRGESKRARRGPDVAQMLQKIREENEQLARKLAQAEKEKAELRRLIDEEIEAQRNQARWQ